MVLNFAGAGSQALAWLHGLGGSSRTILEATDRYTATSLIEAVGFTPGTIHLPARWRRRWLRTGSGGPATSLATRVCSSVWVAPPPSQPTGSSRATTAVRSRSVPPWGTAGYELTLTKGARDRTAEEELVSLGRILKATADAEGCARRP